MKTCTFAMLLLLAAAGPGLSGCDRGAAHADTAAVAEQVRKDAIGLVAAYNAQDAKAAAAYDAPDYVGIYHGQQNTVGPAADEAGMKAQMEAAQVDWKIGKEQVTVAEAGDIAIFEAPYTFDVTGRAGGTMREAGNWIAIFKRQPDGSMKLWRSIASDTPLAGAQGS